MTSFLILLGEQKQWQITKWAVVNKSFKNSIKLLDKPLSEVLLDKQNMDDAENHYHYHYTHLPHEDLIPTE